MKIGELAKATGVSVRMLHHYDEIGLLRPVDRSDSEHRIYSKEDIGRLQKIVTLRGIGLSLNEIGKILGEPPSGVLDLVERHIERLETEVESRERMIRRLRTAKELLTPKIDFDTTYIIKMIKDVAILEEHISHEEILEMGAQSSELKEKEGRDFAAIAKDMILKIREEVKKGTEPSSPVAQELIKQWIGLGDFITKGNPDLKKRLQRIQESHPEYGREEGVDEKMMSFLKEAAKIFKGASPADVE